MFKNRHVTRTICHFLKLKGNHIVICRAIIPHADLNCYCTILKLRLDHVGACKRTHKDTKDLIDCRQESATNLILESKKKEIDRNVDSDNFLVVSKKKKKK